MLTKERIQELRTELEAERISYGELAEIEGAFAEIPDSELPEPRENAMASDMLDELEARLEPPIRYRKHYTCVCGTQWYDEHDCLCNDRCPQCGSEIEPDDWEEC